ncbi:MAG: GntR family transcriptional regulator [Hyphomicrobiales bacterium]|nr:MAG: GntR family transcriptional regulator [Hyphomicrobiales bacterium]
MGNAGQDRSNALSISNSAGFMRPRSKAPADELVELTPRRSHRASAEPAAVTKSASARQFWDRYAQKRRKALPKYAQLRDCILAGIRDGFWKRGDRLPAEQELAQVTGLSLGTVQKAYRDLVHEGTVERRQGRAGSFVSREPKSVDTVWHFLFSDDRHERFFVVYPKVDRVWRHSERGSWNLHLHWVESEVVQVDRIVNIGHEFLVYSQFIIDARVYDHARRGQTKPLEGVNLRRELNLNVSMMTYDLRIEEIPRDICKKIAVPAKTIGFVIEVCMSANPMQQGYFQRIFVPRTNLWLRIATQARVGS